MLKGSTASSRRIQNGHVGEERSRRGSLAPPSGNSHREGSPRSTYEYVKDVPLELFTVSKMVAVPDRQCAETDSRQLSNGRT